MCRRRILRSRFFLCSEFIFRWCCKDYPSSKGIGLHSLSGATCERLVCRACVVRTSMSSLLGLQKPTGQVAEYSPLLVVAQQLPAVVWEHRLAIFRHGAARLLSWSRSVSLVVAERKLAAVPWGSAPILAGRGAADRACQSWRWVGEDDGEKI